MKSMVFLFLLMIVFSNCKDEITEQEKNELEYKTETVFKSGNLYSNNELSVKLDSVTSDSRCPSDVICVWAGNASVKFIVTISNEEQTIVLNTNENNTLPSDTTIQQFHIELIALEPYPISNSAINQDEYEATVVVKELPKN